MYINTSFLLSHKSSHEKVFFYISTKRRINVVTVARDFAWKSWVSFCQSIRSNPYDIFIHRSILYSRDANHLKISMVKCSRWIRLNLFGLYFKLNIDISYKKWLPFPLGFCFSNKVKEFQALGIVWRNQLKRMSFASTQASCWLYTVSMQTYCSLN